MKPSKIALVVILLAAILCCWQSAVSLRQARSQIIQRQVFPHRSLAVSPSRATVVGILEDPNFRVALHALEQRTGVETLAEPVVVTRRSSWAVNRSYYDQTFTFTVTNR